MSNDERIILTVNARGDTTFCVEALKDMSTDRKRDLLYNLQGIYHCVVNSLNNFNRSNANEKMDTNSTTSET